uniref:Uncharacterized protein n=1 Tax=Nelumbo nucifera TaxID=4432 RepID=A0A822YE33_NELNU|nr:TPA_asm: hypothetical protein HUJ06_011285 [Nelumbo nucifera]
MVVDTKMFQSEQALTPAMWSQIVAMAQQYIVHHAENAMDGRPKPLLTILAQKEEVVDKQTVEGPTLEKGPSSEKWVVLDEADCQQTLKKQFVTVEEVHAMIG